MRPHRCIRTVLALVWLSLGTAIGVADADADPRGEFFELLATGYLLDYYASHPVRATQLGIHDYDAVLPDLTAKAVTRRVRQLRDWQGRLEAIDRSLLTGNAFYDHRILDYAMRAELLELEQIQSWVHNPMLYNRVLANGVASLVDRQFAPLPERLESLTQRFRLYPRVIKAARQNLEGVPALWAEIAVRNTRGTREFIEGAVPAALEEQGLGEVDPALTREWEKTRRRALKNLDGFIDWLQHDLQPRADGDYRLGRDLFERKLLYEEHVALTVDELAALNDETVAYYQEWVAREVYRIDASAAPVEVMRRITREHPTPETLIPTAMEGVLEARDLILSRGLLTLPTDELPIIRPTPEYARSGFASMSTPGPFETVATEAYYNITNVDPSWSPEQQAEHLTYFNYPGLLGISVHEAMPGHYVQLLYQRDLPTDVRKVFAPRSLVEGWAHYVEQMMVDEGLGGDRPGVRLGQLRRALQRQARWDAGLSIHVLDRSLEETARRFSSMAYFAPFPALRETQRATFDPTYLYYALGRIQILELREDYRAHVESRGGVFSLHDFHDKLLKLGLPLPLAREALMAE